MAPSWPKKGPKGGPEMGPGADPELDPTKKAQNEPKMDPQNGPEMGPERLIKAFYDKTSVRETEFYRGKTMGYERGRIFHEK